MYNRHCFQPSLKTKIELVKEFLNPSACLVILALAFVIMPNIYIIGVATLYVVALLSVYFTWKVAVDFLYSISRLCIIPQKNIKKKRRIQLV